MTGIILTAAVVLLINFGNTASACNPPSAASPPVIATFSGRGYCATGWLEAEFERRKKFKGVRWNTPGTFIAGAGLLLVAASFLVERRFSRRNPGKEPGRRRFRALFIIAMTVFWTGLVIKTGEMLYSIYFLFFQSGS